MQINEASSKFRDMSIAPMHTAEHILNGTMVKLIGCRRADNAHVERKKSKCDYVLSKALTPEQIQQIEKNRQGIKQIRDAFETVGGSNNILDPSNSESGYYDLDLTKQPSGNNVRTIIPIPLVKKTGKLYYTTNIPSLSESITYNLVMILLDENGAVLKHLSKRLSTITLGTVLEYDLPAECTQIHVYMQGVSIGYTFENICISEVKITEYEPYTGGESALGRLKEEYAPNTSNKPLKDKVIVNFGDSIFGKRRPPNDISTRLAELTGATVHNCGFGGCRMAKHSMSNYDAFSMYRLADSIVSKDWTLQDNGITDTSQAEAVPSYFSEGLAILKQLDFSKVDIITIAYGTNDFTASVNIENTDDAYDVNTFAGALRYSVEKLLTAYPHLKIFVCSQAYRFWMDSNNVFTDDSETHQNGKNLKLTDFIEKTKKVSEEYHLPYINNYDIGMNKYNRSYYFSATDGTHPLTVGCHLIAEHIAKELF